MATEAALVVALEARLNRFEKDLKQAGVIAEREVKRIEDRANKLNLAPAATALRGFIGAFAFGAIAQAVGDAVKSLAEIGDVAERIGVTTDALQTLQFVVAQNGGQAEDATNALTKFSDVLGEAAAGSGFLVKLLEQNNVALRNQDGSLRSIDELLVDFARLVAGAGSQQEKMMLVVEAFGRRAGPQMLVALQEIARTGLPGLVSAAQDAGQVVDKELIDKAQEFDDAWDKATRAVGVSIKSFIVDTLSKVPGFLERVFNKLQELSGITLIPPKGNEGGGTSDLPPVDVPGTRIPRKGQKDQTERQFESVQRHIALMNADAEAVGRAAGEQERLRVEASLTQAILANDESPAKYAERIKQVGDAVEEAANRLAARQFQFNEFMSASRELGDALADAFKQATIEGRKFDEILASLASRLASRSIDKAFDLFFAPGATGGASVFGSLVDRIFGGGRAGGGPVDPGRAYLIGERGPELFMPRTPGVVVPNQVRAGASASTVNVNLSMDLTGANGDETIARIARLEAQRGVQQAIAITNAAAPGRQLKFSQLGT